MKRKIWLSIGLIVIFVVGGKIFFHFFQEVEFIKLDCYNTINIEKKCSRKVVLVKSPPFKSSKLVDEIKIQIDNFKRDCSSPNESVYFVKEKKYSFLNDYLWGDNYKYQNCEAEFDNEDFLVQVHFYKTDQKRDTFSFFIYEGELYYY